MATMMATMIMMMMLMMMVAMMMTMMIMMMMTTIHLCLAGIAKRTQCCGTECHDMVERGNTCNDDNYLNQSGCGSAGGADIADEDDDDDAAGECA